MSEILEHLKTDRQLQALTNALAMLLLNGRWGRDDLIALLDHAIAEVETVTKEAEAADLPAAGEHEAMGAAAKTVVDGLKARRRRRHD
jgi:hypothetical protein